MKTRFNPLNAGGVPTTPAVLPKPKARKVTRKREPVDAREALSRATRSPSLANYPAIFEGFALKGIPVDEIKPRENVFTFDAWRALGRTVRRGEHGVRVVTMIPCGSQEEVDPGSGEVTVKMATRPWRSTVFHISQTDAVAKSEARPPVNEPPTSSPAQVAAVMPVIVAPSPPKTPIPMAINPSAQPNPEIITIMPAPVVGGWRARRRSA